MFLPYDRDSKKYVSETRYTLVLVSKGIGQECGLFNLL